MLRTKCFYNLHVILESLWKCENTIISRARNMPKMTSDTQKCHRGLGRSSKLHQIQERVVSTASKAQRVLNMTSDTWKSRRHDIETTKDPLMTSDIGKSRQHNKVSRPRKTLSWLDIRKSRQFCALPTQLWNLRNSTLGTENLVLTLPTSVLNIQTQHWNIRRIQLCVLSTHFRAEALGFNSADVS